MKRTADRPVASGRVSPAAAIVYGSLLGCASFALLALTVNPLAAVLAMSGLLGYVLVYTMWLKRRTPQNIVIGGAAGAVPPLVAWAAVTDGLAGTPLYLFAIVFFWTPPHFWSLSLLMKDEYARAGVPMLPVVRGEGETRRQILLYAVLLYAVSQLPFCAGAFGATYLVCSVLLGAAFIAGAYRLMRRAVAPNRAAALPLLTGLPGAAVRGDGGGRAAVSRRPEVWRRVSRVPSVRTKDGRTLAWREVGSGPPLLMPSRGPRLLVPPLRGAARAGGRAHPPAARPQGHGRLR